MWVTLLDFFTGSHIYHISSHDKQGVSDIVLYLPGSLINHVSSHDQQAVSDTTLYLCQVVSSIMSHPMTNRQWVTLLYFFARQSHQWCPISWPTVSEWHFFISLLGNLINHVSLHDQQAVSDTALLFARWQSHQLCLIPWPTGSEWHCFISLLGSLTTTPHPMANREWVTLPFIIMSHSMTNREWVTLLYFFQSHKSCLIPWPTGSEWHCFISLPGSLINHVLSNGQQDVSNTYLFLSQQPVSSHDQQAVSDTAYFFMSLSHQSCLIPWPTVC